MHRYTHVDDDANSRRSESSRIWYALVLPLALILNVAVAAPVSASAVTALVARANPSTAGATASYTVSYTPATPETFATTISVEAAPGTTFAACSTACSGVYLLVQGSSTKTINISSVSVVAAGGSTTPNEFVIHLGVGVINSGTSVTIVAPGINPATAATDTLSVWTTTDATPVSASYQIGPPSGGLRQGGYTDPTTNSPAYLQSTFGTPTTTTPTTGSVYAPGGTWSNIEGSGTTLNYLQSTQHWSTSNGQPTPGYPLVMAIQILPTTPNECTPACSLKDGAAGIYNPHFQALAKNLVGLGLGNSWLRLGWEFDNSGGEYATWGIGTDGAQATYFSEYWQQIVTAMRSVTNANFKFVWNPQGFAFLGSNDPEYPGTTGPDLAHAWPGSGYVDYIGLDLYDHMGWGTDPDDWAHYIQPQLDAAKSFASARSTPLAFPEWGVCAPQAPRTPDADCQGDDPTYINNMHAFMTDPANNVAWENYFNVSTAGHNSQITGGSFPLSLQAFKADFGSS